MRRRRSRRPNTTPDDDCECTSTKAQRVIHDYSTSLAENKICCLDSHPLLSMHPIWRLARVALQSTFPFVRIPGLTSGVRIQVEREEWEH
jgi:hypothetical protein